jgi:hypothetical protein
MKNEITQRYSTKWKLSQNDCVATGHYNLPAYLVEMLSPKIQKLLKAPED